MIQTVRQSRRYNDITVSALQTLALTFVSFLFLITSGIDNNIYLGIAIINSFLALWFMVKTDGEPYSLKMLVNLFIFIFFILANAVQFANNSRVLTFYMRLTPQMYVNFQLMVMIILLLYNFTYTIVQSTETYKRDNHRVNFKTLLLISAVAMFFVMAQSDFNPYLLFMRSITADVMRAQGIQMREVVESSSLQLIFNNFIRPLPWACYMVAALCGLKSNKRHLLFLFMTLTVFPTGLARNAAAMYWIPVFIVICRKWITGRRFLWVMILGIFVLFPALDVFKRFSGDLSFEVGLDYLDSINFDASQIFMSTIKSDFVSGGRQLLGALLFFVPRKWWPEKPVGSGHELVDINHGYFNNVSMPFFSEGYVNFGFLGIIIFTIVLAVFCKKMDTYYWVNRNPHALGQGYYLVLLGAIIFIMRGDLMSSFAYTTGVCVSYAAVVYLTTKINWLRKR